MSVLNAVIMSYVLAIPMMCRKKIKKWSQQMCSDFTKIPNSELKSFNKFQYELKYLSDIFQDPIIWAMLYTFIL